MDKFDFKKTYRALYRPGSTPALVQVPALRFLTLDGTGAPEGQVYQQGVGALSALAWSIKMGRLSGQAPEGYHPYVMPPLEGLWQLEEGLSTPRARWKWCSLLAQPAFVTPDVLEQAAQQVRRKHPELPVERVRLETRKEGLCVQLLHTGPYAEEARNFSRLLRFLEEHGLQRREPLWHHEIYLSDPRRCAPDRLKTVLRMTVAGQ